MIYFYLTVGWRGVNGNKKPHLHLFLAVENDRPDNNRIKVCNSIRFAVQSTHCKWNGKAIEKRNVAGHNLSA